MKLSLSICLGRPFIELPEGVEHYQVVDLSGALVRPR
jgi:hypothetical protein